MATPGKDIVKTIVLTVMIVFLFQFLYKKCQQNFRQKNKVNPPPTSFKSTKSNPPEINSIKNIKVPKANIKYYSSSSWLNVARIIDAKITGFHSQFQVTVSPVGSQKAKQNLINKSNETPFIVSSSPLTQQEHNQAIEKQLDLRETPVALDGIAFVVSEQLPLTQITKEQIRKIYNGEIDNWNEIIPSYNQEILAIYPNPKTRGTGQWFKSEILQEESFDHQSCNKIEKLDNQNICFVQENTQGKMMAKENNNAIFFATASQVIDECGLNILEILNEKTQEFIAPYIVSSINPGICPNKRNKVNTPAFKSQEYPIIRYIYIMANFDKSINQEIAEVYIEMIKTDEIQAEIDQNGKFMSIINSVE